VRIVTPMPALEFPQRHVSLLRDLGTRLLDSRRPGTENISLARELLAGFHDTCTRGGLDGVLAALEEAFAPLDITDRSAFADSEKLLPAVKAKLDTIDLDDGSPRAAKPYKLVDALFTAATLTIVEEPDRTIAVDDTVRAAAAAAIAKVIDVELALPRLRDRIIAEGRANTEEKYTIPFDRLVAQLDERGMKFVKQLKLPVDAVQAVERILLDARRTVVGNAARAALDRAVAVLATANAAAAARIDQPITYKLTPRDVALARACDPTLPKLPAVVATSLIESIAELARIQWKAPERQARPYGASQTFAVGEVIDHPKFGRGTVKSLMMSRIDVEFADSVVTLVHKPK
jgi:hypothetical protein